jgi:hypothetical protein
MKTLELIKYLSSENCKANTVVLGEHDNMTLMQTINRLLYSIYSPKEWQINEVIKVNFIHIW